jgi:KaiC/GvpD/RAD55 family RecA-like ATPase
VAELRAAILEVFQVSEEDMKKYHNVSWEELRNNINSYKAAIDVMNECLYRKHPNVTSLKKTIIGLNKLQSKQNEDLALL